MRGATKVPSLLVTTEREMPREASANTTVAPGTTAPVVSATVPWISPVVAWDWGNAGEARTQTTASPAKRLKAFLTFSSPDPGRSLGCCHHHGWARGESLGGADGIFGGPRKSMPKAGSLSPRARAAILPAPTWFSRDARSTFP